MTDVLVVAVVALVMAVGVAGTVVPVLPGLALVWLAALGYGLATGFGTVGLVAMAVLTALALAGTAADWVLPGRAASGSGATRRSLLLGAALAVVGFFVVPVVGLPLGGVLGVYVGERLRPLAHAPAWRATVATLRAYGMAALAQVVAGLAMVVTWIVWVLAS